MNVSETQRTHPCKCIPPVQNHQLSKSPVLIIIIGTLEIYVSMNYGFRRP